MAIPATLLSHPRPTPAFHSSSVSASGFRTFAIPRSQIPDSSIIYRPRTSFIFLNPKVMTAFLGAQLFALSTIAGAASASESPLLLGSALQLTEPPNALSIPTWAIHISSVVEWITAMALVWQYGEKSRYKSWKGLSWGMVPLLGGAFCACTWHFFYNSESLEVLVAIQAALTVVGNATMCIAAFRIYESSKEQSENL